MNTLVIGDLHAPFILNGYLEFCKAMKKKYKCKRVVFIGDIVDNHYSSFHDSDPDGMGAGDELYEAKEMLKPWFKSFPKASVCFGNHDLIILRKAYANGLSKDWIRPFGEVIGAPRSWEFRPSFKYGDVLYTHGTGRKAKSRAIGNICSTVQGHYHAEGYVWWSVGNTLRHFAMQVGCGIDRESYAMAYGKEFNKPHISCGIVLNDGETAILEYMDLGKCYGKKKVKIND